MTISTASPRHLHRPEDHLQNPLPTVGTVTEIYDYLRLLWARVGTPTAPSAARRSGSTVDQIIDQVMTLPGGHPHPGHGPRHPGARRASIRRSSRTPGSPATSGPGDGSIYDLTEEIKLDKNRKHSIEVVVDRLVIKEDVARRLTDSVETAAALRRPGGHQYRKRGPGPSLLPELRLRGLRHLHRRAGPPHVLLQQPLRRLSHLYRSGQPAQSGPLPSSSPTPVSPFWRAPSPPRAGTT